MSLGSRTTKSGAKVGKDAKSHDKGKGIEKTQPKEKTKPQATTEQLRLATMIECKTDDGTDVRRMVLELMEMTCRTEEEVCSALHDADNDMTAACEMLLDQTHLIQSEWQTSEKKKKKPPASTNNGDAEPPREQRSRSGPRPRRGESEGGRGRGGRGRGGRGGGRGGARPSRRPPPRSRPPGGHHNDQHGSNNVDSFPTTEDWDNEEWSGSLSDTKVFTASSSIQNTGVDDPNATQSNATEDWECAENGGEPQIPSYTYHNSTIPAQPTLAAPLTPASNATPATGTEPATHDTYHTPTMHQPMGMSGSLSAAQSQYLSQLTQQSQRHDNPGVYGYNYGAEVSAQRRQRARVPPPSKIPMSAVEMPGGEGGGGFLDLQFGATDDEPAPPPPQTTPAQLNTHQQVSSQPEVQPTSTAHETTSDTPSSTYANTGSMLSESLSSAVESNSSQSQPTPASSEPTVTSAAASLEKQLTASMKQLSVTSTSATHHQRTTHKPAVQSQPSQSTLQQTAPQQNVYHHPVTHHPPVYTPNVYAPQVNSNNTSLTGAAGIAGAAAAYPSSVTLTHYQPIINSYQTSTSGGGYGGAAVYSAYTPHHKMPHKDAPVTQHQQYDNSVAASSSLTTTSTTQTTTAKVATTTVSSAGTTGNTAGVAGVGGAGGALYNAQYAAYDDQLMRTTTLPHQWLTQGGYYEVGYGSREGGERFPRADAASPQHAPPALPPGYAYFYQPPPTTYQYTVYPTYGGGSSVGGGSGKVSTYQQQQPPYDAQDTYKPGGPYTGTASKSAGGASADLTNAMYAKTHVALNKVNSYEKAAFHSGTPPPFGAASTHLYIPAPPHHHPHHHAQPQMQMDVRVNSSHGRRESGSGAGGRGGATKPAAASKPTYSQSYWPPN